AGPGPVAGGVAWVAGERVAGRRGGGGGKGGAVGRAWSPPADPPLTGLYACDGANNMTGFCDPVLDDLLVRSDHALTLAARKPLLDRAQERLAETARTLPLFHNATPELVSKRVGGYRGSGTTFGSFCDLYY